MDTFNRIDFTQIDEAIDGLNDYWNGHQCPELERRIIALETAVDVIKQTQLASSDPPLARQEPETVGTLG
jgi:hypothetical protein